LIAIMTCKRSIRIAFCRAACLSVRTSRQSARLALSGHPVDQACGIQQRRCLIEQLLDVESDFKPLLMKARPCTGVGCAPSRGLMRRGFLSWATHDAAGDGLGLAQQIFLGSAARVLRARSPKPLLQAL
jgi:hypothetical protein